MAEYIGTVEGFCVKTFRNEPAATTDDHSPSRFRPHGRVEFVKRENVLICYATGPFNVELIEAVSNVEAKLIEELVQQGKWGDIIVLKESAMASPGTVEAFASNVKRLVAQGVMSSATALVLSPEVEGAAFMSPLYVRAYSNVGMELHVCKDFGLAWSWVKARLG